MRAILVGAMAAAVVALFVFMLSRLSSDALGMAVGVVLGVLAGVPSALLVLASSKRNQRPYDVDDYKANFHTLEWVDQRQGERALPAYPYQPPVIVLAAPVEDKPQAPNTVPTIYDRQREIAAQNGVPGKIRSKPNGCSFQPLSQPQGGRVFRVIGEREEWSE